MAKEIKGVLYKYYGDGRFSLTFSQKTHIGFCGKDFRRLCPVLAKGMKQGEERKVKLIQLKNGIKLVKA